MIITEILSQVYEAGYKREDIRCLMIEETAYNFEDGLLKIKMLDTVEPLSRVVRVVMSDGVVILRTNFTNQPRWYTLGTGEI